MNKIFKCTDLKTYTKGTKSINLCFWKMDSKTLLHASGYLSNIFQKFDFFNEVKINLYPPKYGTAYLNSPCKTFWILKLFSISKTELLVVFSLSCILLFPHIRPTTTIVWSAYSASSLLFCHLSPQVPLPFHVSLH